MSINKLILDTLKPFNLPIKQDLYDDNETSYFIWNIADDRGGFDAENIVLTDIISIQVHLFVPISFNYLNLKKQIRQALTKGGFSYPQINIFVEEDTKLRHIVYSCEIATESEDL